MAVVGLRFDESALNAPIVHDPALIILSFVVAVMTAYATLELAERLRGATGVSTRVWHGAGSLVLGGGLWAMLAIALLALTAPMVRGDAAAPAALSAFAVIVAAAFAFWILRFGAVRGYVSWVHIASAGTLLGVGVAAMLFLGISALQAGGVIYRPSLFSLSVATAIATSTALLWFSVLPTLWWHRALAAIALAAAFCGLHYTSVAATALQPIIAATDGMVITAERMAAGWIALAVTGAVMIALVSVFHDRQRDQDFANEAVRVRKEVARRTVELQTSADQLDAALATAERASAAKSEFLASMSHELRTPLNSILGFSQLLMAGRSFEPLSAKQAGAMQQIEQAGRHLLLMIDDILDISRIEAGRLPLSIEEIEVAALIDEATAMLQPTAITASVTLHTDAAFRGLFVRADRRRLLQIIINLLSNAIKYNRQGGSVSISCREVDGEARISISDTGMGIPAHQLDAVFEPFNRSGQDWSATPGHGVGLALCKRLVEAMRGSIRVDSVEGKGSTFALTLPLGGQTEWVAPMFPPRATVLYIEDNPASVLLMRHIMNEMGGVELVVATTPREGIELARGLKPSLILLDLNLPDMDGYETLKAMRADDQIADIAIFAVTANALPRDLERGVAAGFDHYLTKPLNIPQFVAAVEVALTQPPVRKPKRARVKREALTPTHIALDTPNTAALVVKAPFQPLRKLSLFGKPRGAAPPPPLADPQNQSPAAE